MKWKIDNLSINNQVVLAPMSGICDYAFRKIIKSMNCGLIETEMISDKSILQNNARTQELLYCGDNENPLAIQIFGSNIETFKKASKYIEENTPADIIDINMGCPVRKVADRGNSGSALLKNPKKAYELIESVVNTVNIPVTVKIRSGWDESSINAVEIAKLIEKAGASAITVHPRTKKQGYNGKSDWNIIKEVKKSVDIPIIGNGDIKSCYDAKKMIDHTGCDSIMIGRGTLGNPWLIKECVDFLNNKKEPEKVKPYERINILKTHAKLLSEYTTKEITLIKMRKHAAYYIKGLHGSAKIKTEIFKSKTTSDLITLVENYMKTLH